MRKLYLLFCIGLVCFRSSSQAQKIPNSLLWRISGNGLQKPSYLYGTLHLTDERIFNFGDSLYSAIEKSDGFAIEVNPDDMTPYIVDLVKREIKNGKLIKDMMNEKEFKKYSTQLSKKLNKPADHITSHDIFREKNKWLEDGYRKGKMETIVDAYLFDIARRQGKWTGGVEDMSDQAGLIDNLIDESDIKQIALSDKANSKNEIEQMTQVYINSDLNSVDSMINFTDSSYRDALLIKRNKKMARRMDSLAHVRAMVFAVGTAHLPGAEGLIKLLRSRGFNVEPVFYSKKIKSSDYTFHEVDIPWTKVDDPNGYYHVNMPGKPGDIEMYGLLEMKMYFNIFNSTGYLVASINVPHEKKNVDSMLQLFATNVFKERKLKSAKDITINNISGKELESRDMEGYKHGYILYKNNVIYLVVGFATTENVKPLAELKKFLASYQPVEKSLTTDANIFTYVDSAFSFKIDLPSKPQSGADLVQSTDKSIKSNLMVCVDQQSGSYFLFGVNQAAPGYSITNDSATLRNIHDNVIKKYSNIKSDTTYVKNNHRVLEFEGHIPSAGVNAKIYYEFRGNRWYGLVAMYGSDEPKPIVSRFMESFTLLDYPASSWAKRVPADSLFTIWGPSPIRYRSTKDTVDVYSSDAYEMYDGSRGTTYEVVIEDMGKYFWQTSDTSFWNKLEKSSITYKDTLLSKKYVQSGNLKGVEIVKKEKGSFNIIRKRTFLFGDTAYTLVVTEAEENSNDKNINKFFDDFTFNKPAPVSNLKVSKAKILLEDLLSKDSATRSKAYDALKIAPFQKSELPMLHEALLKKYIDTENDYQSTNSLIVHKLADLKDNSSLDFAKKNYALVSDSNVKNILLQLIAEYKTKENYVDLLKLLQQSPPVKELPYSFRNTLNDSLKLSATMFPGMLTLLKDTIMAPVVLFLAADLLDSNAISVDMIKPYSQDILKFAAFRYKKLSTHVDEYVYEDRHLIKVLGKINSPDCNSMLQKWLQLDKNYLRIKCVVALTENKQVVDPQVLLKLAKDKNYRLNLYDELKELKSQNLFPRQYLTQQYFAESMVYESAIEDDYEPNAITFIAQKIISFKGKKSRFFFFKVSYEEEEKTFHLGCAGPFDVDATKISSDKATGHLYYEEEYTQAKQEKQIAALIKSMEEDE
ncbi:MAG: TraB/GumN family protein [Bacteroidetes bacterium]|nr:TraB/GumN family protein [Bacteroidota bacterium]